MHHSERYYRNLKSGLIALWLVSSLFATFTFGESKIGQVFWILYLVGSGLYLVKVWETMRSNDWIFSDYLVFHLNTEKKIASLLKKNGNLGPAFVSVLRDVCKAHKVGLREETIQTVAERIAELEFEQSMYPASGCASNPRLRNRMTRNEVVTTFITFVYTKVLLFESRDFGSRDMLVQRSVTDLDIDLVQDVVMLKS